MDNLENPTPAPAETDNLREQYEALRHLVTSMLVLMLIISGTLTIYLLRQYRSTKSDLEAIGPNATQAINAYQHGAGAAMDDFVRRLADYSRSHPDYAPIAAKYHLNEITAVKPGATPAPATKK